MAKLLRLIVLAGLIALIVKVMRSKAGGDTPPAPDVAAKRPPQSADEAPWVDPDDGECPLSHPVKLKASSGIFHEPGMLNYERTHADRCYRDAGTAEADGFRASKV